REGRQSTDAWQASLMLPDVRVYGLRRAQALMSSTITVRPRTSRPFGSLGNHRAGPDVLPSERLQCSVELNGGGCAKPRPDSFRRPAASRSSDRRTTSRIGYGHVRPLALRSIVKIIHPRPGPRLLLLLLGLLRDH